MAGSFAEIEFGREQVGHGLAAADEAGLGSFDEHFNGAEVYLGLRISTARSASSRNSAIRIAWPRIISSATAVG